MSGTSAESTPPELTLLAPDEPAAAKAINESGRTGALLICDHASNFVPASLGTLGLDETQLARHIAFDIGAGEVTRQLAERLDAPAVLSGFSRLIVDPNRTLDAPSLIPEVSDGVGVPGNRDLLPAARQARIEAFHRRYHEAIDGALERLTQCEAEKHPEGAPVMISVHSFTPVMDGTERPWHVGILWNRDPRLPLPLMERLRALGLEVGDNLPYSGRDKHGYTLHRHAEPRGLANALIEIRQDLIDTHHGASEWAALLAGVLGELLADPALYRRQRSGEVAS